MHAVVRKASDERHSTSPPAAPYAFERVAMEIRISFETGYVSIVISDATEAMRTNLPGDQRNARITHDFMSRKHLDRPTNAVAKCP
jgi:hypothetical protein